MFQASCLSEPPGGTADPAARTGGDPVADGLEFHGAPDDVSSRAGAGAPSAAPSHSPVRAPAPTAQIHWVGSYATIRHPADLYAEMTSGETRLVVVDARYPEVFTREHLPGAVNMPVRQIDAESTAALRRDASIVVYCWNESCHASMKAAARFAALGFEVNELHGGLQAWKRQGYPTERG